MEQSKEIKITTLQNFRQPIVTATGIILGFVLDFAATRVTTAFSDQPIRDLFVAIGFTACITLLLIVLYRILRMDYPRDNTELYYRRTLTMFVIGVSIPFVLIIVLMIERLINRPIPGN